MAPATRAISRAIATTVGPLETAPYALVRMAGAGSATRGLCEPKTPCPDPVDLAARGNVKIRSPCVLYSPSTARRKDLYTHPLV